MNRNFSKPQATPRRFLPDSFSVTNWDSLQPFYEQLKCRKIDDADGLRSWLRDMSELEAVVSEDACWRQIKMTCDTTDAALEEAFTFFCAEIEPKIKPYAFELNKKLLDSPFRAALDQDLYFPYLRNVEQAAKLYREENIQLQAEANILAQQYGAMSGKMSVEIEGKVYTMQQAAKFLQGSDRAQRESVFGKMSSRRLQDRDAMNELFDKLLSLRQHIALNAGYANYRDYKFAELGRFDYTWDDCFAFHEAVKEYVLPLHRKLVQYRKSRLGLEVMRPWDGDAEPEGTQPLKPFATGHELLEKSEQVFAKLNPFFSNCLSTMKDMGRMDLESRQGKAPGGYNCPLAETGVPFIFMNAAGTMSDVITMMHEGGHAVHSFLSHNLELSAFKEYPMEIAELASMSMELFTMEHWGVFFNDENELKRAQLEELERVISVLPWIATIDKFQHWLYTNPGHSVAEREAYWISVLTEFSTGITDWSGYETYRCSLWQKQLHLFEVPFYYIEYGIAQLGALAMWRQYIQDKEVALENYMNALSLGYTKPLTELYKTAGISFGFAPEYVGQIAAFASEALAKKGVV